eukprot:SAG31_NODE_9682_length_1242_cov_1.532808_2_plen_169_part_00
MFCTQAVEIDGSDISVWYKMGVAGCQAKQLSFARYALESAISVNKQHWPSVELLVEVRLGELHLPRHLVEFALLRDLQVLFALGDDISCQQVIEHALQLNPFFSRGLEIQKSLEPCHGSIAEHRWVFPQDYGRKETTQPRRPVEVTVESWHGPSCILFGFCTIISVAL